MKQEAAEQDVPDVHATVLCRSNVVLGYLTQKSQWGNCKTDLQQLKLTSS